ncbi:MAG: pyrroline-5-carboxylate reductase [Solimicrobium sp.]|jgi:pyrroline-5-carboxylate reductase|nr:pyrroline-5-carboxylate reductase [Solimicrobium sp.]
MSDQIAKQIKISFIGGGNMAKALISGLCANISRPVRIHVVDVNPICLTQLKEQFGVTTCGDIDEQIANSDVVLLSVKPQQLYDVARKLTPFLHGQLIISIAAGIRVLDLSGWLNNYTAIVRTMPNMPALINSGITGMYAAPGVSAEQRTIANGILSAVGTTVWLENEALLDPLTAISGSGPAYVFYFIGAMQKAAEEMGLTKEQGRELALATFSGASRLAAQSNEPVTILRERVTSKGGTTYAAIKCLEEEGVSDTIVTAIKAASARARELGDEYGRRS